MRHVNRRRRLEAQADEDAVEDREEVVGLEVAVVADAALDLRGGDGGGGVWRAGEAASDDLCLVVVKKFMPVIKAPAGKTNACVAAASVSVTALV